PWNNWEMPSLIEAIEIKRKSYFEYENAPYHCLDVEVSKPTARGGQTLVRLKMRNLITRAVFDKTFKAGEKFSEPDLVMSPVTFTYADGDGYHFMDQNTFETLTLSAETLGEDRGLLVDNVEAQIHRYNGQPIGIVFPPHVELTVARTEMGVRGNTASGSVTKTAVLETGLEIQVPLFIKEGERVRVHTDTREFAGRA
ncbi:MAG TPA: elongation factor P, partial [Vicinamibacterales bacterium]